MKRAVSNKHAVAIVFGLTTVFLLTEGIFAARPRRPVTNKSSTNPYNRTLAKSRNPSYQSSSRPKRRIDLSGWTPDTSFGEAIEILRNSTTPPLNILVLWRDLEDNADITRDTPIGMKAMTGVSLRKNIDLLLLSVSAGGVTQLSYIVKGGVIVIATKESLPSRMETRVYDVTDLLSRPANYRGMGGLYGGMYGGQYGGGMYGGQYGGGMYGGQYGGGMYGGQYGGGMYGGQYGMPYGGGSMYGGQYGMPYGGSYSGQYGAPYGPVAPRPYTGGR